MHKFNCNDDFATAVEGVCWHLSNTCFHILIDTWKYILLRKYILHRGSAFLRVRLSFFH